MTNKTHYVYRITHIPTGRFYIGIRSFIGYSCDDNYMGSGVIIKNMLKSHPIDEFNKEIISEFTDRISASKLEADIVNLELLQNPLCLNLKLGGDNSKIPNQFKGALKRTGQKRRLAKNPWENQKFRYKVIESIKETHSSDPHPFMVSNGYWWVWKDSNFIYQYWLKMGGVINSDTTPKRGCGYKAIGYWYSQLNDREYNNLVGDESVFRNMIAMFKNGWIPELDMRFMKMIKKSVTPGIFVLRGTSGTGKGTRVVQFIEWLMTIYTHTNVVYEFNNKPLNVGIWFEDINLVFIGKYTRSNKSGLTSWTSMDFIHSTLKTSEMANSLVKYIGQKYKNSTVILEGEPMMQSHRWRPEFVYSDLGYNNMAFVSIVYNDREEYDKRIIGRSGKAAKETGWGRNEQYKKDYEKIFCEFSKIGYLLESDSSNEMFIKPAANMNGVKCVGYNILSLYDSPLWSIGELIVDFVGLELDIGQFKIFCDTNPMTRNIDGTDPLAHRVEDKVKIKEEPPVKKVVNLLSLMGKKK